MSKYLLSAPNFNIIFPRRYEEIRTFEPSDIIVKAGSPLYRGITSEAFEIEVLRKKRFEEKKEEAKKQGRNLFAGFQYRLSGFESKDGKLILKVGPSDYGEYVGTEVSIGKDKEEQNRLKELGVKYAGDEYAFFSRILAVNSGVNILPEKVYMDHRKEISHGDQLNPELYSEKLVLLRSPNVAEYWLNFHNPGGHADCKNYEILPDFFHAMKEELKNELGVEDNDIVNLNLIGICESSILKPELLFSARVNTTLSRIKGKEKKEAWEHSGCYSIGSDINLMNFIMANQNELALPEGEKYEDQEKLRKLLKEKGRDPNNSNYLCPSGEAQMIYELMLNGFNVELFNHVEVNLFL